MKKLVLICILVLIIFGSCTNNPKTNTFKVHNIEINDDGITTYTITYASDNKFDGLSTIKLVERKGLFNVGDILILSKEQ